MENEERKYTLLEAMVELAPYIQRLVPLECNIAIADTEKFVEEVICQALDKVNNTGKPIPEGSGLYKAIKTGEAQENVYGKELYGVPFKSVAVPVKGDRGAVIGGIAAGISLKNREALTAAAHSFASTTEEVVASTEELAASAQELSAGMEALNTLRAEMEEQVNKTEVMLNFIKKVAANSNLLGLNAAIEAARVGEAGRGFEVVATEIRKMAENSTKSVEEIKEIIETIKQKVAIISEEIPRILEISQHQATATQEIAASIQGLSAHVEDIERIALKI